MKTFPNRAPTTSKGSVTCTSTLQSSAMALYTLFKGAEQYGMYISILDAVLFSKSTYHLGKLLDDMQATEIQSASSTVLDSVSACLPLHKMANVRIDFYLF